MYAPFFGLTQAPFSIAPDPRMLFMSERHREALAHLLYGLGGPDGRAGGAGGGFVLLTGEIGTGKTTVCRCFLEQIPASCNVAYIFNPKLTVIELLQSVCDEFHIAVATKERQPPTVKDYLDPLNAFLLRAHGAGQNNVLIIDEAQNLSAEVLEQLRLLTNLETSERKLLQIVLIGQPELRAMLQRPELEQLAQRVIARYHLDALTPAETAQYIQHRLDVAGLKQALPFDRKALKRIHQLAHGVPRRINLLCDRALLGAFAGGQATVSRDIVNKAAGEVFDPPARAASTAGPWRRGAALVGLGLVAGAGLLAMARWAAPVTPVSRVPEVAAVAAPPPAAAPAVLAASALVAASAPVDAAIVQPVPSAPPPTLLHDENQAWRELAQAWKLTPGEGAPCQALAREQVRCFGSNTSLALIRQLGRPGIVKLDSQSGSPSYALLTALTPDSATLRAGDSEQTVTLAALAARWQGDFSTLWRSPAGYSGPVNDGQGGPAVQWVAARLATLDGTAPPAGRPVQDAAFKARVRAFQLAQGLPADGLLGPLTFMQLNRAAGVDEPTLRTGP
ncbi:AAA family ATPase [Polaromonas sp.]|uniref:AAA family ATPase n=1 Tax=Polaromonas sp. TaxID=1869339 RepID=UPI00286AB471|nr:AAA family ATPase [Polaromonas sp.]